MTDQTTVQYMGFNANTLSREYAFAVRTAPDEPVEYTLTIDNEAFVSHRVSYQDAPGICSLRLHQELDAHANHPPTTHFSVTDAELANYKTARKPKAIHPFQKRKDE